MIVVSAENYEGLRHLGNITDSFNDVITELLKAAQASAARRDTKV